MGMTGAEACYDTLVNSFGLKVIQSLDFQTDLEGK